VPEIAVFGGTAHPALAAEICADLCPCARPGRLLAYLGRRPGQGQTLMEQSLPLFRQAGDLLGAALAAAPPGHQLAWRREAGQGGPGKIDRRLAPE
jgi:hypothetical protein